LSQTLRAVCSRRQAEQERNDVTFGAVFEDYLARHVKGKRKAADVEREMRKDLLSRWKDKPLETAQFFKLVF
jgi:hypothetical protein